MPPLFSPPRSSAPLRHGVSLFLLLASTLLLHAQQEAPTPTPTKSNPPAGTVIPEADRQELTAGVKTLGDAIAALAADPRVRRDLLPDVEIFLKAVDWPLRYDEFYGVGQVGTAKALLKEGLARAAALRAGQAPWTTATGPVVRGYRSRIDGSAQPYGIVVPASWQPNDHAPKPLYIWNHGRNDNLTELAFISARLKGGGEFKPAETFVVDCYGRYCNATKFAGETDVMETLEHVTRHYSIDPLRRVMIGFSMGGASTWHLATHYASLWVAASPGAGFAETPIYTKAFAPDKVPPPWYEQVLYRLYDATDYVANLTNTHLIAYSGEIDPQKQSADLMEATAQQEGLPPMERLIGPKTAHKYEPATKKELATRLDAIVAKGRVDNPAKVRLVTYTLAYNRQGWLIVDALEKHWERADMTAEIADPTTIRIKTQNVAAFSLEMQGDIPLEKGRTPKILLDGQELLAPAVTTPWVAHFRQQAGHWSAVHSADVPELHKHHGLQGPIDDAFTDSFVFVRPTGKPLNDLVGQWVQGEMNRALPQWRSVFRGDARVVDDTAVTPELLASANLVLWGDPSSNAILARILPQLPVQWSASAVSIGKASYPGANFVPILIYPNPLNPKKYVVLNSSFTFRQGSNTTNALQIPNLPDWALVDLRTPPDAKSPGLVMDAGFFGEKWEVQN